MKQRAILLLVLGGSMILALLGNLAGLAAALAGSNRAWRVAVSNDQTANAGAGGSEDETISSRAGKAARAGRRWGCILCRWLDAIDPGHCERHIEHDEGAAVSVAATSVQSARTRQSQPSSSHT